MVEVYADDGISATSTAKRDEFNRMIADCKAGKIDMILTKSISRFARNTVDCLKYTRELKALNIAVFFEKENINTLDAKDEVLITIMAALAQQESESLSANVLLGIQFRNQQGQVRVNHNWFLGYTKDEEGKLVIVPEEVAIARRIYAEYLDGKSFKRIKQGLEADGIINGAKHEKWHDTNIRQILTNEKYIGDALLQNTYTVSVLDKKRVPNNGLVPKYYVEGSHEAMIDKDTFLRVQAELLEAGSDQSLIEDIGDAIINLREERQSILTEAALKHDLQERMEDLISFLDEQTEAVTEYSEPLARRLIEKITVYDEKLVVEFKSGLTVEVEE